MRKSMIMAGVCLFFSFPAIAHAAPYIAAQTVTPMCQVQGNTVFSVAVTLNGTTANFYGATLWYHFIPVGGGTTLSFPSPTPAASPVKLAVDPGAYKLVISPNQGLTPSASQSPEYPVTVPGNLTLSLGSKKVCNHRHVPAPRLDPPRVKG
jgi:hypothetical protein